MPIQYKISVRCPTYSVLDATVLVPLTPIGTSHLPCMTTCVFGADFATESSSIVFFCSGLLSNHLSSLSSSWLSDWLASARPRHILCLKGLGPAVRREQYFGRLWREIHTQVPRVVSRVLCSGPRTKRLLC